MKGRKGNPRVMAKAKVAGVVNPHASEHKSVPKALKCGGPVMGKMGKMRLDRPGRKRGGRVGADMAPLSSAKNTITE